MRPISSKFVFGAILIVGIPLWVAAQGVQVGAGSGTALNGSELRTNVTASDSIKPRQAKPALNEASKAEHSAGVDEILKMMQAGVSTDVIHTYIEASPIVYSLSAADIIALKEHAVPDDLTTAMLKRGAVLTRQLAQLTERNAAYVAQTRPHQLDPESYEYFQYYYLLPRSLAAANQRLLSPYASFGNVSPYGYGFYGASPLRP